MKRLADQTLYEILEVPQDAAPPTIEAAYDRARSIFGPGSLAMYTLITSEEATLLTSRIEEAKRTLLDPDARARYDASLGSAVAGRDRTASGENGACAPALAVVVPPVIPALPAAAERRGPALLDVSARPEEPLEPAPASADAEEPVAARAPAAPEAPPTGAAAVDAAPAAPPAGPPPIRLEREVKPLPALAAPVEIPVPDGAVWTGEALRRVREARGITVQLIADRTKVTRHHIENIEAERFSALPAAVYLRGILLSIARELRLDGQKVARAYLERAGPAGAGKPR